LLYEKLQTKNNKSGLCEGLKHTPLHPTVGCSIIDGRPGSVKL